MTIGEAIRRADAAKPNAIQRGEKVRWLSDVDMAVFRQLVQTHERGEELAFIGYDDDTPAEQLLLAVAPYDRMYVYYLLAQIDLWNNEIDRYQNSAALYNQTFADYANYYNRRMRPLPGPPLHF